ncbi:MAG TPA: YihY/virulence factor BrkB family protein [Burkholderiales bacterium]|nr:YihY/virulence factor BrkB family protein [Burkholderiales bacterium]
MRKPRSGPFMGLWNALTRLASAWSEDRCGRKAAAVAYYTAFSLAPILVIVLAVAGLLVETTALSAAILDQIRMLIGEPGAALLGDLLAGSTRKDEGGWAALAAFVALLVGATTAFAELKDSLDEIFQVERRSPTGLWGLLRARLLSFGLVLVLAFLLLVSLAVNAVLAVISTRVIGIGTETGWLVTGLSWIATLVVVLGLFAAIYKLLPEAQLAWRDVLLAAGVTALLFMVGRLAIGAYLGNSAPASAFGAAGSLAVLLLWVFYSASIFFIGAEITRLFIARRASEETRSG